MQRHAVRTLGSQKFLARIANPMFSLVLLILCVLGVYTEFHASRSNSLPSYRRYLPDSRALRHELSAHQSRGCVSDFAGSCIFHTRGEGSKSRSASSRRRCVHVSGAIFLVRSPLTPGGVSVRGSAGGEPLPFAVLAVVLMRLVLRSRRWENGHAGRKMNWVAGRRDRGRWQRVPRAWFACTASCGS